MPDSAHITMAAFWQETASGTGPANATAWVSNATRMAPVRGSIDVEGIGEEIIDDMRSRERVFDEDEGQHGIDNPQWPMEYQFECSDEVVTGTNAITETAQMTFLAHILGGLNLGTRTTASGTHSSTTVEVASGTGMDEGVFIAPALSAYREPTACHLRRITGVSSLVLTVDQEFPNAPVNTDVINPVATVYIDQDDLLDSSANDTTLSWLLQLGPTGGDVNWECVGCKSQLDSIKLDRNAIATFVTTTFGGQSTPPDNAANPTWTTEPAYNTPVVIGPDCQVWMEDYGTTTNTLLNCSGFSITPGIPVVPEDLLTEGGVGLEARGGYTTKPDKTMIEITSTWDPAAFTDFEANTLKALRFSTLRPAGQNIGFSFPRVKIKKVSATKNGDVLQVKMLCQALEDTQLTAAANEDLYRSKMTINFY